MPRFLVGVNYWPRRTAMYAWQRFDLGEMREDFSRMRALGFDVVRFFLSWEAFAPHRDAIDGAALRRFDAAMQALADARLVAIPTLFCGHMSGVNWLPAWTLDRNAPHGRFRTIAGGSSSPYGIGDFYADEDLVAAQLRLARAIGERANGHAALLAWDLGNEFSNLRAPRTPLDAAAWSAALCETLLEASGAGCTAGTHGEDVENDRAIRPSSLAARFSFASMHGYPVYATFSRGRADANVVPFYDALMRAFSAKRVLFTEFGNPQCPPGAHDVGGIECLTEDEMAAYARAALERLVRRGAIGALWWCWADYDPSLAGLPPFDTAPHELRFGIVRSDGSEKPVAKALSDFAREARTVTDAPQLQIAREQEYYASLPQAIFDAYDAYCRTYA
ncbi:MAG: glycoside hydrolase 5 family protein [Candidatus Tyrphobacter sp.]